MKKGPSGIVLILLGLLCIELASFTLGVVEKATHNPLYGRLSGLAVALILSLVVYVFYIKKRQ